MRTASRQGSGTGARALRALVSAQKRGEALGIYSVCSSHPEVLQAALEQALSDGSLLLVESTSNQVNPEGGYTGERPADFAGRLERAAAEAGLPLDRLVLGGDHLGPFPWQAEPAAAALGKARELVRQCVAAGYEKIHLDASMGLADDPGGAGGPLDEETVAERTADLAAVAEAARREREGAEGPVYVVGTEVPTPGGEQEDQDALRPTRPEAVRRFLGRVERAFLARGLEDAWGRVVALVVQPGVEFGDTVVHEYAPEAARELRDEVESIPGVVYEAHSTDYQTEAALRALVRDHFAFLKVGPALTFAFREAVYALERVEEEWLVPRGFPPSGVRAALEQAMSSAPRHWSKYYRGDAAEQRFRRSFSRSDRIRYYWPDPGVERALGRLRAAFEGRAIPSTLLSQYLPWAAEPVRSGAMAADLGALCRLRVRQVLEAYARACGMAGPVGTATKMSRAHT